ncbi:[cytidine(C)-cytidine(C)-adenosine (A)]-adding enzyme [Effusibacillus lacus]|uniref:[cytidine(C)-cytidine(C)-adenosine (A)]-adding enzyme n=1 Tax=Effusibacillus lacus TaxID=1348429 RepID=A0A292YD41_9BACL|nr:[cytidine(C)-cytidine(C)-adenosine (A)]-adding enzyme [Effusibacillus lacus]
MTIARLDAAWEVLTRLEQAGFQAYLVGGCVRDMLLGLSPEDYDVTTNALPEQVQDLFPHTVPTGIPHGTVSVLIGGERIEVTTFRKEEGYLDGRRPTRVEFVDDLRMDLSRRDFTFNAMAMDSRGKLQDPFHGRADLQSRLVRAVGKADERFREDALRMLRAVRFATMLNATIEEGTRLAIRRQSHLIVHISRERIRDEWNKILVMDLPIALKHLTETDLLQKLFPRLHDCASPKWMQAAEMANRLPPQQQIRQAALFWGLGINVTTATECLRELRQPTAFIRNVTAILKAIPNTDPFAWSSKLWRHYLYLCGKDAAHSGMLIYCLSRPELLKPLMCLFNEQVSKQPIWSARDLAVTGRDIASSLKITPGPKIGKIRQYLIDLVLENPSCNSRSVLLAAAASFYETQQTDHSQEGNGP